MNIILVIDSIVKKMMRYTMEPRDLIFVKVYEFFSFTKIMSKNLGKKYK